MAKTQTHTNHATQICVREGGEGVARTGGGGGETS